MTSAAQEDVTGMPTPKQDDRTPGLGYTEIETEVRKIAMSLPPSDFGSTRAIQAVARWVSENFAPKSNTYGSTDALRSALAPILSLPDACVESLRHQRQVDADGCEVGVSRQAVDEIYAAIVAARTALARYYGAESPNMVITL